MYTREASVRLHLGQLRRAIQSEYELVARDPSHGFHFHTGRPLARMLGYGESLLNEIPESAIESFAGTGNPFQLGKINPGERVVDVGAGAGIDSLIAARMTGPDGQVVGVDMTPTMLKKARKAAEEAGLNNVDFRDGHGEALPVPDGWADVVISNGVLNLMPNKSLGIREMARVLRPDGRLQIADILVEQEVPEGAKADIDLWTGWIAGALQEAELQATVVSAGFVAFEITWRVDVFADAPQASGAAAFGTKGINFRARKPQNSGEWQQARQALICEVPRWPDLTDLEDI